MEYILDKYKLAGYFINEYYIKYNRKVSQIKLQKGLYFLFAFWVQYTKDLKLDGTNLIETHDFNNNLFRTNFRAWSTGAVDLDIYTDYINNRTKLVSEKEMFIGISDTVVSYVKDMMSQIYEISDFSLIDIATEDKSWSKSYNASFKCPEGNCILECDIIKEYENK